MTSIILELAEVIFIYLGVFVTLGLVIVAIGKLRK
jgi:hypothetical protein